MRHLPFEVSLQELLRNLDDHVERVFRALESDFLFMPRGDGFVDFDTFADAYARLNRAARRHEGTSSRHEGKDLHALAG